MGTLQLIHIETQNICFIDKGTTIRATKHIHAQPAIKITRRLIHFVSAQIVWTYIEYTLGLLLFTLPRIIDTYAVISGRRKLRLWCAADLQSYRLNAYQIQFI